MSRPKESIPFARAQVDTLIQLLLGYKAREQAQLRRANARPEAVRICSRLREMAQIWYPGFQDLRRAYETVGTPHSEWKVSQRGGTRSRTLEPEVGWLIESYLRCRIRPTPPDGRRGRRPGRLWA